MTVKKDTFPVHGVTEDPTFYVEDWEGSTIRVEAMDRCNVQSSDVCAFVQCLSNAGASVTTDLTITECYRLADILIDIAKAREAVNHDKFLAEMRAV